MVSGPFLPEVRVTLPFLSWLGSSGLANSRGLQLRGSASRHAGSHSRLRHKIGDQIDQRDDGALTKRFVRSLKHTNVGQKKL